MAETSDNFQIKFKKINKNAVKPSRGSVDSAGYDLYSCEEVIIPPNSSKLISIGIILEFKNLGNKQYYGRIASRSGLSCKKNTTVGAGVIDKDYTGEIHVLLHNLNESESVHIKIGDRVAQIIFEKIYTPELIETEYISETERGANGFGSTGV